MTKDLMISVCEMLPLGEAEELYQEWHRWITDMVRGDRRKLVEAVMTGDAEAIDKFIETSSGYRLGESLLVFEKGRPPTGDDRAFEHALDVICHHESNQEDFISFGWWCHKLTPYLQEQKAKLRRALAAAYEKTKVGRPDLDAAALSP
jgi:hypothetical protein